MPEEANTKPTIETVLDRINVLGLNLGERIDSIGTRVDSMSTRIDSIDARVSSIDTRVDNISTRVDSLGEHLSSLGVRVERLESRGEKIESEISRMRQDVKVGFRTVARKIMLLNNDFLEIRSDNEDLLQRVENLESKAS